MAAIALAGQSECRAWTMLANERRTWFERSFSLSVSECAGAMTLGVRLVGQSAGRSTVLVGFNQLRLSGTSSGAATCSGNLSRPLPAGQSAGSSSCSGTLTTAFGQWQGEPIPIISLQPNWDTPFRVSMVFNTQVKESLAGSEWRRQLAPRELYSVDYLITTTDARQSAYLRKLFELADAIPMGVPLWPNAVSLTANASAGASTLTVERADGLLTVFKHALVWQDEYHYELVRIDGNGATSLTLDNGIANAFTAGAQVIPLMFAFVPKPDFDAITDEHADVQITATELFEGMAVRSSRPEGPERDDDRITLTACRDIVRFNMEEVWTLVGMEGGAEHWAVMVEYGPTESGPWTLYHQVLGEDIDPELDADYLEFENYWDGNTWLRFSLALQYSLGTGDSGGCGGCPGSCPSGGGVETDLYETISTPMALAKPQAAVVACPEISVGGAAYICPRAMSSPITTPRGQRMVVSCRENETLCGTKRVYQEVIEKYETEYAYHYSTPSCPLSVTAEDGATFTWTNLFQEDPKDVNPSRAYCHTSGNDVQAWASNFGGAVRVRAQKDGCWSPCAVVLVDKKRYSWDRYAPWLFRRYTSISFHKAVWDAGLEAWWWEDPLYTSYDVDYPKVVEKWYTSAATVDPHMFFATATDGIKAIYRLDNKEWRSPQIGGYGDVMVIPHDVATFNGYGTAYLGDFTYCPKLNGIAKYSIAWEETNRSPVIQYKKDIPGGSVSGVVDYTSPLFGEVLRAAIDSGYASSNGYSKAQIVSWGWATHRVIIGGGETPVDDICGADQNSAQLLSRMAAAMNGWAKFGQQLQGNNVIRTLGLYRFWIILTADSTEGMEET